MESAIRKNCSSLVEMDNSCVWHPFTQKQTARSFIPIVRGKGLYLYSENGRSFLDGVSSWWVNLHGHAHPYIVERIKSQAELLEHAPFADFTHPPAIELASKILSILPGKMTKVFYSDNGSTAVEVALKMAFQYWYNHDSTTQKKKVICFKGSYHGDTFGAMAAAGRNEFNKPFWSHLFEIESIPIPLNNTDDTSMKCLETFLQKKDVACFIFEPLILGSGGMKMYSASALDSLLELCRKYHVLTIADEVMTGFGRTGPLFACEYLKEQPDIICLSKGLTGGFLPLGITACIEQVYQAFLSDNLQEAFLHGHSYTANPLACASALANMDLLSEENCSVQRKLIELSHQQFCEHWKSHPKLKRCEVLGTILALEYQSEGLSSYFQSIRDLLYHFFLDQGILLRPLGNVLYVLPPYCIKPEELQFIYDHIVRTLEGDI